MSKILFIYPDIREELEKYYNMVAKKTWEGMYYVGIASISAVLKKHNHDTSLIHIIDINYNINEIFQKIENYKPDIIAYSSTTNQIQIIKNIAPLIKKKYPFLISILGGVNAILDPEDSININGIDIVCTGEGEYVLLDLANNKQWDYIEGIWFKDVDNDNSPIHKNPKRKLINNLDELPFLDTEIFNYMKIYDGILNRINITISRGCPFDCNYCCNHAIKKAVINHNEKYVRFHSPEYVIQQIKEFLIKYPTLNYCDFRDDVFTLNKQWVLKFLELYKKEINLPMVIIARADNLEEDLVKELAKIPTKMARIGIETGSEKILNTLNRTIKFEHILKTAKLCKKYDIKIYPFYMIGFPEETPKDFIETIKFHSKLVKIGSVEINSFQLAIFQPFEGTKLHEYCKKNNLITNKRYSNYMADTILNLPKFPRKEMLWLKENFIDLTNKYINGMNNTQILELMNKELY